MTSHEPPQEPAAAACDAGDVVDRLIRRLRGRRGDIVACTAGTALRLQVTLTQESSTTFRFIVTTDGTVGAVGPDSLRGERFAPHLLLVGSPQEVIDTVSGRRPWQEACDAGTAVGDEHVGLYQPLLLLVGAELADLLRPGDR